MLAAILLAMVGVGVVAYIYRDQIAAWLPGWKHAITGSGSFVLALMQYFQTIDYSSILGDAKYAALATAGVGLLVLVLSWVTPRRD